MRRRLVLVLAALALLGSCTAAGLSLATRDPDGRGTVTARADVSGSPSARATNDGNAPARGVERAGEAAEGVTMTVTGSTTGLLPGRAGQLLPVVVANPAGNPAGTVLTVSDLRVVVTGPAGSCPPEDLRVGQAVLGHRVPRGAQVVLDVPVTFVDRPDRDQTDCLGRTFPLRLSATAEVQR